MFISRSFSNRPAKTPTGSFGLVRSTGLLAWAGLMVHVLSSCDEGRAPFEPTQRVVERAIDHGNEIIAEIDRHRVDFGALPRNLTDVAALRTSELVRDGFLELDGFRWRYSELEEGGYEVAIAVEGSLFISNYLIHRSHSAFPPQWEDDVRSVKDFGDWRLYLGTEHAPLPIAQMVN